jgi:hypothetical protein
MDEAIRTVPIWEQLQRSGVQHKLLLAGEERHSIALTKTACRNLCAGK